MKVSRVVQGALWAYAAADRIVDSLALEYPFISHDYENDNYIYGGSAVLAKSYARLTADQPDQRGFLYARELIPAENFEIEVEFKIEGAGNSLYGDGMAVWLLSPDQEVAEGSVFGLKDYFMGTAILIDTYRNHRPGKAFPYVVLMQNDGRQGYDNDNDGKANELAGYSVRGLHNPASNTKMKIRYQGGELSVEINHKGRFDKAFSLPYNLDGAKRLAFSASTGQLSERHDIYSVRVTELDYQAPNKPAQSPQYAGNFAGQTRKSSPWTGLLVKLSLGVAGCVGALKMYKLYIRKKKYRAYEPFEFS
ncbi:hypothetical protein B9G98_01474 [Wickerhamiella sorbophila]|uniref:L-type lectin-like domain-containing protein n=1 Tax=Wickerhamiella sorbophila TaxID=45607 RepID=A0A2T0FFV1_9ASCO|nr:hypothetical protein B9G98_01474 [Wickerhamiella sorbophila]PRT53854.1 hypothetical protein B9G98_01474 [Wickerhamiella sorbophila]